MFKLICSNCLTPIRRRTFYHNFCQETTRSSGIFFCNLMRTKSCLKFVMGFLGMKRWLLTNIHISINFQPHYQATTTNKLWNHAKLSASIYQINLVELTYQFMTFRKIQWPTLTMLNNPEKVPHKNSFFQ